MPEKKIRSTFMIEPSLKQRAEKMAEEEGLTYSALLRKLLLDYVDGDSTTEDEIREIKKGLAGVEERIAKFDAAVQDGKIVVRPTELSPEDLVKCLMKLKPTDRKKIFAVPVPNQEDEGEEEQQ